MTLPPFDRTCHRLSCRVIDRRDHKLPQTKNICIIRPQNDADNYMTVEVFSPFLLRFSPYFFEFSPYFREILFAVSRFLEFTRSA